MQRDLLRQPQAVEADYATQAEEIVSLLGDACVAPNGLPVRPVPGVGAGVELWVMGSSPGSSSTVAGELGLRFAVAYHVVPAGVLDTVDAYRAAFRPSAQLKRPYVAASADVVVAEDEASARELATGYGAWVRSIRTGRGAIPFPTPAEARGFEWTEQERDLVADRLATQFVGTPAQVADSLELLAGATGADELIVTTITHRHADRVRSYRLLAQEWQRRRLAPAI